MLDGNEEVYSAAQQMMVKNVQFNIMHETLAQTMAMVVRELKQCMQLRSEEDEAGGGVA